MKDLEKKFKEQKGLCHLTGDKLTHIYDDKGSDRISNMSIIALDYKKSITYINFSLVTQQVSYGQRDFPLDVFLKYYCSDSMR